MTDKTEEYTTYKVSMTVQLSGWFKTTVSSDVQGEELLECLKEQWADHLDELDNDDVEIDEIEVLNKDGKCIGFINDAGEFEADEP